MLKKYKLFNNDSSQRNARVQFSFINTLYRQINGIAMGYPLGPTLANIFMGYLEYKILPELDSSCKSRDTWMIVLLSVTVQKLVFYCLRG